MMLMDLTNEFVPVLFGLNALFVVCTALVFGPSAVDAITKAFRRSPARPQLVLHRPALAR